MLNPKARPFEEPSSAGRPNSLARALPFAAFFLFLLYKQRVALLSTGIAPGPEMMLAAVAFLAIVTPWLTLLRGRWQPLLALLVDLLLTIALYGDLLYWRQFGDLVSVASLRFAGQLATVGGAVTALVRPGDLWLFIDLPVLLIATLLWREGPQRWLSGKAVVAMGIAGALIVGSVAHFDPLLSAKYYGHSNVASRMGLLNYHLFDAGSYFGRMALHAVPSPSAVAEVHDWFKQQPVPPASSLAGIAKGKNVIYIQVESLQAFTIGLKVNGQEVTPNLNRLAKESIYFPDFYSQTGQGVTSDADLLGNCSLYPTRTGAVYYDYAANDFRCMPTLLRENGYKSVAMQGMPPDFWNLASVYPHVGFEHYYSIKEFNFDDKVGIGLSDKSFFHQVIPKLKALPEPYYAFLVSLTSHGPFDFEGIPHDLDLGDLKGTVAGHYLDAVHYTDAAIGQFVDQLKAEGILDKSVLVLDGDHAGVFRTGSGIPELLKINADDEVGWTQMEHRVPLLIHLPGGAQAGEHKDAAGQVDIAPTLAGLLGIPTTSVHFMGKDVFAEPVHPIAFYTGTTMTTKTMFWNREDEPDGRCYDRATGERIGSGNCQQSRDEAAKALAVRRLIIERNLAQKL